MSTIEPDPPAPQPDSFEHRLWLGNIGAWGNPTYLASLMGSAAEVVPWHAGMAPAVFPCPMCGCDAVATAHADVWGAMAVGCPHCEDPALLGRCREVAPRAFDHSDDTPVDFPVDVENALAARIESGAYSDEHKQAVMLVGKRHAGMGTVHRVRGPNGATVALVGRYDRGEGNKEFIPLHCVRSIYGHVTVAVGLPSGTKPIVGWNEAVARPHDPVLLVEGEKTRDAAAEMFPSMVAITSFGGAGVVGKIDWSPLAGRSVTVLPDNDEGGANYARTAAAGLYEAGAKTVLLAALPSGLPKKWDVADPLPVGVELNDIRAAVAAAAPMRREPVAKIVPVDPDRSFAADVAGSDMVLRKLIAAGLLSLDGRREWIRVGMALKHEGGDTQEDEAFDVWHRLSQEAAGYAGEEDCRRQWGSFRERPGGRPLTMATYWGEAKKAGLAVRGGARGTSVALVPSAKTTDWSTDDGKPAESSPPTLAGGAGGKPDAAATIIAQAEEAGDEFFLDLDGTPHVSVARSRPDGGEYRATLPLDSPAYDDEVRLRFFEAAIVRTAPPEQIKAAKALQAARARHEKVVREVHLRTARVGDKIYVDLGSGDGRAVEVDAAGYRVVDNAPVYFGLSVRGAFPAPEPGGTVADLERHMPSIGRRGAQIVLGFCVGSYAGCGTNAMLCIGGAHGTNKSTVADMTLALADPPAKRMQGRARMPADDRDLLIHAMRRRVLCFDNVSSFGASMSDSLCTLLGGTELTTRTLYENTGETAIALARPVIVSCIGTPTTRGDLLDRTVPVLAKPTGVRLTERAVWDAFYADHGKLFGLVLSGVSAALRNAEQVRRMAAEGTIRLPRLSDFAEFVEGAAEVLGLAPGEFSDVMRQDQGTLRAESSAGDPIGAALVGYFSRPGARPLDATSIELLRVLSDGENNRDREWPAKNKLRGHLERIAPGLAELGIEVEFVPPEGKANVWRMRIRANDRFLPISVSPDGF